MKKLVSWLRILFTPCRENNYKSRFLESKVLLYCLLTILILKLIAFSFIVYFPKTIFFADLNKALLIELTNQERELVGLSDLKENPKLSEAAELKAQDILKYDYFSHQSPQGVTPWYWFKKADYNYQSAGENLAIGFLDSEEVIQGWKNSFSHQENLLNPAFQEIGLAVLKGDFQGGETAVVVQLFGEPISEEGSEGKTEITKEKEAVEITQSETEKEVAGGAVKEPEVLKNNLTSNFFKFMTLNYPNILQAIIFYFLLIITFVLILNIFIERNIQDRRLIFKTVIFIVLLISFVVFDKELTIQLIPHNLLI